MALFFRISYFKFSIIPKGDQVIHQSIRSRRRPRHQPGDSQIETDRLGDERQLPQKGDHHIAEVIVTDGVTRQPGIERRESRAAADAIEKSELHGLLGGADSRILRPDPNPQGEHASLGRSRRC